MHGGSNDTSRKSTSIAYQSVFNREEAARDVRTVVNEGFPLSPVRRNGASKATLTNYGGLNTAASPWVPRKDLH